MHEKRLVTFRMAPKKSKRQMSEKEATMADGWKKSKLSEAAISSLVSRRLLQSRALFQWQPAESHGRLFERTSEIVLLKAFVERGLALPTCDFLRGLLFLWGIQIHHLTPDSILHIAIFVQLCEVFLGIYPHFDLFKSLFSLNPCPNLRSIARVGGADLQFCSGMAEKYIPYSLCRQIGDWKAELFYIDNHAPALPERTPGPPKQHHEWCVPAGNADHVGEHLERIAKRRREG